MLLSLAIVLMPIAGSAQTVAAPAHPRDLDDIVAAKVLQVAVTHFDLPAFHWHKDGVLVGPEIDLAKQLGAALGVAVEFDDSPTSFNGVVDAVRRVSVFRGG